MDTVMMIGILFLIAGFILIGVEMVVPGFGVPGISGIVCLMAGIFLTADSIEQGVLITVVVIVALGILMTIIMGFLSQKKFKSPIILDTDVKAGVPIDSSDLTYLLGKEGVAATDLKPAGKGDFEGVELDIFSEGQYIKKGTRIVISKVNQKKLMVKEL
ncbi:NfeD family protein [Parablautia intestinalis]|uniref:NfeD family protein n=1 Tax=Parablautia intestinalis TaxID=2320100 RepID=UPI0023BBCA7A|nr:NfeD family protein [Parablautia intestinalis]MCI8615992.1 serine protease [Lachnospiraceae bacterium]MDE7048672.1 serine protease [Lachnospiraceae bacterium]